MLSAQTGFARDCCKPENSDTWFRHKLKWLSFWFVCTSLWFSSGLTSRSGGLRVCSSNRCFPAPARLLAGAAWEAELRTESTAADSRPRSRRPKTRYESLPPAARTRLRDEFLGALFSLHPKSFDQLRKEAPTLAHADHASWLELEEWAVYWGIVVDRTAEGAEWKSSASESNPHGPSNLWIIPIIRHIARAQSCPRRGRSC